MEARDRKGRKLEGIKLIIKGKGKTGVEMWKG